MLWILLIFAATLFVAYANGANDNFKGVATLFGSGTTDYRKAIWWATATTLAGSLAAAFIATQLVSVFQGHGLIPSSLAESHPFVAAVILSAALTVFVAAKMGIPISTTHSLMGAMVGSGVIAAGSGIGFDTLLKSFFLPLLVSPVVAVAGAFFAYPLLIRALRFAGFTKENCVCIAGEMVPQRVRAIGPIEASRRMRVLVDEQAVCEQQFVGAIAGVNAQSIIDAGHFLSAGAVSFARGLNDTPKIVALGLLASALDLEWSITLIALTMALGGLLGAKKVAETVSKRITPMDADQGFAANVVTSSLVIFASSWGLPVSTTHVSCGALFGIGIANGQARWSVIRTILLAWFLTLPIAAVMAGILYSMLSKLILG